MLSLVTAYGAFLLAESFHVSGRGLMHLGVLLEEMRREGYEIQVGRPEVILKRIDDRLHEHAPVDRDGSPAAEAVTRWLTASLVPSESKDTSDD